MAVSSIYPLDFLNDLLITKEAVTVGLQRNDEMSGSGDGRYWAAELARPLWTATLNLSALGRNCRGRAREIDAKFRALGVNRAFLWADPTYDGPRFGATAELAASTVTIRAINTGRTRIALSGLPAGFVISPGDRFSVEWATGRHYMAEFLEEDTAISNGTTGGSDIYPLPPLGMAIGMTVNLIRPTIKAIVPPDGFTPYSYIKGFVASGASLTLLQKV